MDSWTEYKKRLQSHMKKNGLNKLLRPLINSGRGAEGGIQDLVS
jgi:hypothetical protein